MNTLESLYKRMLQANAEKAGQPIPENVDADQLDCLLHPEKHPLVWRTGACNCSPEQQKSCAANCQFGAITPNVDGSIAIDETKCLGCYACIDACKADKLTASKDIMAVLDTLRTHKGPVYALVAPAVAGQFGADVTAGKLRTALKNMRLRFTVLRSTVILYSSAKISIICL